MNKKIFNVLVVLLIVFIAIYLGLKVSNYGQILSEKDASFKNGSVVYNLFIKK